MFFGSLWKSPGSQNYPFILPFLNGLYENPPFLHEIDPELLPDWQSGPFSGMDFFLRDTGRGIPQGVPPVHPLITNTSLPPFGRWLISVNVFRFSLEIARIPELPLYPAFSERVV